MADYDNRGDRGGNNNYGNKPYGRPAFVKKSWGKDRQDDKPTVFHKATCSECGKTCEVPFRPTAGKPIYCKDCFAKRGGNSGADTGGYPKRDFHSGDSFKPQASTPAVGDKVAKELELLNTKLERLIRAVETIGIDKLLEKVATNQTEPSSLPPKTPRKKNTKK